MPLHTRCHIAPRTKHVLETKTDSCRYSLNCLNWRRRYICHIGRRPGFELEHVTPPRGSLATSMSFTQLAEACAAPTTITLNNGKIPLLLLDGGMGTCLQLRGHNFSDSPLWSASLIEKDGQTIVAAHSDYLEAGADIIMTNTFV